MHVAVLWLCGCVYLNWVGWTLSALHQLNPAGYAAALLPGILLALVWLRSSPPAFHIQKLSRRFRRPLPATFLFLSILIFLGGVLYAPTNYDALTYRLPRMLNWLSAEKWLWIPTTNDRMNYSATAWEWTGMPLLALARSDRGLFLINALGYLLMPGLLFSVFRQLGVARRVAWTWMWILPAAYGYALQAGGIGNDLMGGLCCLLSIQFGLRARTSGRITDVWLALLAVGLMTGVKLSNLPLALPCLVAVWPGLRLLRKHLAGSLTALGLAVLVSAAPMMTLNYLHTGDWSGDPDNKYQMQIHKPATALLGNCLLLGQQTLMPPVLPMAVEINRIFVERIPTNWQRQLHDDFPRYYLNKINELPGEESASLGLGVTLPLLIVLSISLAKFRVTWQLKVFADPVPPVALATWVAILFYLLKMGSEAGPRLLLPYYALALVPLLRLPAQATLLRFQSWRLFLVLSALSVLPAMVLSPSRPLWPAQIACNEMSAKHPENKTVARMTAVYTAYAGRNDTLAPIRKLLPPEAAEIGVIAGNNDTTYSLWRPFGTRKVTDLCFNPRHFLEQQITVEWVVVKEKYWPEVCPIPLTDWAAAHHAQLVKSVPIVELVGWGAENWVLLHFAKSLTDYPSVGG